MVTKTDRCQETVAPNPSHSGTLTLHAADAGCYLTRVVRPCQEATAGQTSPETKHGGEEPKGRNEAVLTPPGIKQKKKCGPLDGQST